jgi:hypothetical protein
MINGVLRTAHDSDFVCLIIHAETMTIQNGKLIFTQCSVEPISVITAINCEKAHRTFTLDKVISFDVI